MTTALTVSEIPHPTPRLASSLSQDELERHRSQIGFEVRTVLSAYFQPQESDEIRANQIKWWADELQDWDIGQVVWGLRKWNRDHPRLRPTVGDIVALLKAERGRQHAKRVREQRQDVSRDDTPVSEEQRAQMAEMARKVTEAFKEKLP